ncbi:hypothetical protein Btru_071467 [Bulinus truncatus]|nr:hypothetical protein Btru_071467 [Bulinus truncatus]
MSESELNHVNKQAIPKITKHNMHEEWQTLKSQVGGHRFEEGNNLGMVDLGNGFVLKSLQNPPRGVREYNFYQKVFDPDCRDPDLIELREFMPQFHGTVVKNGGKFLKLANLTYGYKRPCVIDLKMGKITYDQEATPEKIAAEIAKYPPLEKLGFQITGMMIYDPTTDSCEKFEKNFGKSLTSETIITEGLEKFFRQGKNELRKDALQPILSKLLRLESWFLRQKKYSFIASSLFMVFEGSKIANKMLKTTHLNKDVILDAEQPIKNDSVSKEQDDNKKTDESKEKFNESKEKLILQKRHSGDNSESTSAKKAKLLESTSELKTDLPDSVSTESLADVHLIDYAHAFPATNTDLNFLFGLQKLISILKTFIK